MADIKNEIDSISDYISQKLQNVKCIKKTPKEYKASEMLVRFQSSKPETETNFHYRLDRTYQLVYFGKNESDCITQFSGLEQEFNNDMLIPLRGADVRTRYISIGSFSLSRPFETENGTFAIMGYLEAGLRESRPQKQYEKMNDLTVTKED